MTISKEQLEKMQMWHSTVALMGVDLDAIDEDWDDDCFNNLLTDLEKHYARLADPSDNMKAVLVTHNMGVCFDEINNYISHLADVENAREQAERDRRIATNEHLVDLHQKYDFQFITTKQYPKHKHFTFHDKKGLLIRGRIFRHSWCTVRVWLYWKDAKGKSQNTCQNYSASDLPVLYPTGFPGDWDEGNYYRYTFDPEKLSYIIAYRIVHKKMEKGYVYPNK